MLALNGHMNYADQMSPSNPWFNGLMNYADQLSHSNSCLKRNVGARAVMLTGCLSLELLIIAQKTIKLPFEAAKTIVKLPSKFINVFICSATLREFAGTLPGPIDLIKKVFEIIDYAIGAFLTLFWGSVISPPQIFKYHVWRGLIEDDKIKAEKIKAKQKFDEKIANKAAAGTEITIRRIQADKDKAARQAKMIEQELAAKDNETNRTQGEADKAKDAIIIAVSTGEEGSALNPSIESPRRVVPKPSPFSSPLRRSLSFTQGVKATPLSGLKPSPI